MPSPSPSPNLSFTIPPSVGEILGASRRFSSVSDRAQRELLIFIFLHHDQVLLNDYFESLVRLSYENTQRVKLLKGAVNVQEQNLHLILQDYIPSLLELYRIHPLSFPSIPSRLLPYNFEHTLPCGIVLRKKPKEEPTYNIPSSFSTNNYYNIYSTSPVHYQPIKYFCIGNHLDNLSIINYLMRLRCTLYLPQVEDLEAFGPCFGLQHSTSVIIVTPATKDQIRQVVAGLAQFDQLIATAQRKARDGEDYTADIDNIQYVSKYVEKYYWVLEILTPFIVNQRSDYPEHFIITVSKVTSGPLLIIVQKLISTRNPRPPTKNPPPENQPDNWYNQESLDLEPDLAARMTNKSNQGSKAVLASPLFEFIGKKETYVDWKNVLANYFIAYPQKFPN
ncbi:hypothetical protein SERLADRAFT_433721 [Serpula lacrymans var. lacrymans S7.9]|uniref:Uncharacterized protein n=1 Tax=Serpula lacrymans var. lacrymans (strain S7.9) TaxID=578457 RepID=F8NIJ5_SERL9|nr:uncharacterized protein SERLADRAFT_433721 [Serpula lacrymans var. lacrymans S7.9]EGO29757.1 hypothetical protein SERLADRAFT_433721 [Serpula lacrymans var. lacrymans S7.9]